MLFSIIGQIIVGFLIADFISGLVHWFEDRLGDVNWPFIGPNFIVPNREHHVIPLDFLNASFYKRNRGVWLVGLPISLLWLYFTGPTVLWFTTSFVAIMSNEIHAWSHKNSNSTLLKCARATGLIQSPGQHARHHLKPYDNNYCVCTNWLNPILDHFKVWSRLENFLFYSFGIALKL